MFYVLYFKKKITLFQATLIIFDSGEHRFYSPHSRFQCSIHFILIRFQIMFDIIGAQRGVAGKNVFWYG